MARSLPGGPWPSTKLGRSRVVAVVVAVTVAVVVAVAVTVAVAVAVAVVVVQVVVVAVVVAEMAGVEAEAGGAGNRPKKSNRGAVHVWAAFFLRCRCG